MSNAGSRRSQGGARLPIRGFNAVSSHRFLSVGCRGARAHSHPLGSLRRVAFGSRREVAMSESGFFSGLSVVIPVASDEDPEWLADLVWFARGEASEIVLVLKRDADVTALRPALGAFGEKVRIVYQSGDGKADALNRGLTESKNQYVIFLDCDVDVNPGQISAVLEMLEGGEEFVSVGYGGRPPTFAPIGFVAGWFFGARRSVFLEIGGWASGFVEDVETAKRISRSGHKIAVAPFAVRLRRPVRRPMTKLLSVLTSFGRK